jgi:predicted RNase H-like nuclease (RuvC/YqgF family)
MNAMTPEARRKLLAAALSLILGLTGIWLFNSRSEARGEVERLQKKLEISRGDAGAEIEALETEIFDLEKSLGELRSEFDNLTETRTRELLQQEELAEELNLAQEEIATLSAALGIIGELDIALMPDLSGSGLELAREFAEAHGATVIFETVAPGNLIARPGAIVEQLPLPGTPVIPGTVIWVQVFSP